MNHYDDLMTAKWNQVRGSIKQKWGELTDDEIAQAEGSREELIGLLQERYYETKQEAAREVDRFLDNLKAMVS